MKFLIVGGFLGSGKTSFILNLAKYMVNVRGIQKVAILENEIGEVGVDDKVLRGSGYRVKGMFSGCVCCTMAGELPINVRMIQKDYDPEWIIMEATGVAFPDSIKEHLHHTLGVHAQVVCIADAQRWKKLFKPLEHLLPLQLKGADFVLLNKADLVNETELKEARESIRAITPETAIICTCAKKEISGKILDRIIDWEG